MAATAPARADDTTQAQAALAGCLDRTNAPASARVTPPPGLSRDRDVTVARLSANRLFAYRGTGAHEIACGIAVYGPVPAGLRASLVRMIESHAGQWVAQPKAFYSLAHARPATITYWGAPRAPGLSGVMLMERAPSPDAPSLEIDYHGALIP